MDRVQKAAQMITEYTSQVSSADDPTTSLDMGFARIMLHLIREFDPPAMEPETFRRELDVIMRDMPGDISLVPNAFFPFLAARSVLKLPYRPAPDTRITTDDGEVIEPFVIFSKMYHDFIFDTRF